LEIQAPRPHKILELSDTVRYSYDSEISYTLARFTEEKGTQNNFIRFRLQEAASLKRRLSSTPFEKGTVVERPLRKAPDLRNAYPDILR